MRLAALGLMHESNTFVNEPTDCSAFEECLVARGDEIPARLGDSQSTMAGFLDVHDGHAVTVQPLMFSIANPRGPVSALAFDRLGGEMLRLLQEHGPWDGVLMAQHGAAVSENHVDADAELVTRAREIVGPDVPLGVTLDLHGNVGRRLVAAATVVNAYRTNPHGDARTRARECAELVIRAGRGDVRPCPVLLRVPVVPNILRQSTDLEPMRTLYGNLDQVLQAPGLLSASILQGYPYADVPDLSMSVIAVGDGDPEAAQEPACRLASAIWAARSAMQAAALSPEEAVARAAAAPRGPIVLLDVGDNIGGGSPGDSTVLLAEAIRFGVGNLLQTLHDPESVAVCAEAGAGERVALRVGAKADDRHGRPVPVTGQVLNVDDGRFEDPGPTHGGFRHFDGGTTAVLASDQGPTLVLHSKLIPNTSLEEYRSVGIDPAAHQLVVAKGVNAPRFAYAPIAAELLQVDTPGVTTADLSRFTYRRRPRPLYPFEPDLEWSCDPRHGAGSR